MLTLAQRRRIERACVTVKFGEGPGRGCLVPGPVILTAAHTITGSLTGQECVGLAMGDHCVVELGTTQGRLHACPYALEHVSDCAVLGALDTQTFFEQAEAFDTWCSATAPVPLCLDALPTEALTWIAIYTHQDRWVTGTAYCGRDQTTLWIEVPEGLYGATSGSPIVNARGAIVGVVSQVGGSHPDAIERGTTGPGPRPHTTLPVWVVQQIAAAQADVGAADVEALEAHDPGFQP